MHDHGIVPARCYQRAPYDAMIAAAPLGAGGDTLWSEHMHAGLFVEAPMTIRNLFA